MAVDQVNLKRTETKANPDKRTGEKVYQVIVTDPTTDDSETARTATGIPRRGDGWSSGDPALFCIGVTAAQDDDSGLSFSVTAEYSTIAPGGIAPTETEDPLAEPPLVEIDNQFSEEPIDRAIVGTFSETGGTTNTPGDPIVNTLGQLFDPPPMQELGYLVYRIQRNVAATDATNIEKFLHSLNVLEFTLKGKVVSPGTAFITHYTSSPAFQAGTSFDVETIFVAVRDDGWNLNRLNTGVLVKDDDPEDPEAPLPKVMKDRQQYPYNTDWPLDINGDPVATLSVNPGIGNEPGQYHYRSFNVRKWQDYTELGAPFTD